MAVPSHVAFPPSHPVMVSADAGAIGVAALSFMGYLPSIAALLSIIWLVLQIVTWIDNWRNRHTYREVKKKVLQQSFDFIKDED